MKKQLPFLKAGVAQVALVVEDLDTTVENYWKLFGVGPWTFYTYERPLLKHMSYRGKPSEYSMRLALANVGPLRIELIEMKTGETVFRDFVAKHGFGVQHLGLLVDDMPAAIELAKSAGYQILQDGGGFGVDGDGWYAYLDTEEEIGVTLELVQRPKARVKPDKVYPADGRA